MWLSFATGAIILGLVLALFAYTRTKHFAAVTYDMAAAADDAGHEKEALALFKEACSEGSAQACQQISGGQSSSKAQASRVGGR